MRKTDEEILVEYLQLKGIGKSGTEEPFKGFYLRCIARAREDEPRINSGIHLLDWEYISDEDDDFDSFYGKDYFNTSP
jgi:hypothetical protein